MPGPFRPGIVVSGPYPALHSPALHRHFHRYPRVAFEVFPLLSGPQLERLREGSLDAGILYLDDGGHPGLEARRLQHDHLLLAVPETSPWAGAPPTTLAELADADFVWGFRSASPVYY